MRRRYQKRRTRHDGEGVGKETRKTDAFTQPSSSDLSLEADTIRPFAEDEKRQRRISVGISIDQQCKALGGNQPPDSNHKRRRQRYLRCLRSFGGNPL
ncbi:hypothetical protein NHF48_022955 [Sphingomonas sp. H160509]|uniref:hypothetical protein n=1 Tax=Sphingomonas sp. H160509 TaxID=2955313 RepID=UPI0021E6F4EA|nr:hypothetical protein [Sphingomonas sp. H160509]MDD1453131.1 hypothetical protein [Sphingomonas sp. H160509]